MIWRCIAVCGNEPENAKGNDQTEETLEFPDSPRRGIIHLPDQDGSHHRMHRLYREMSSEITKYTIGKNVTGTGTAYGRLLFVLWRVLLEGPTKVCKGWDLREALPENLKKMRFWMLRMSCRSKGS